MTPPKTLYRVRLAREIRQEAEVEVWAEDREDADRQAQSCTASWKDSERPWEWIVSIEESA